MAEWQNSRIQTNKIPNGESNDIYAFDCFQVPVIMENCRELSKTMLTTGPAIVNTIHPAKRPLLRFLMCAHVSRLKYELLTMVACAISKTFSPIPRYCSTRERVVKSDMVSVCGLRRKIHSNHEGTCQI